MPRYGRHAQVGSVRRDGRLRIWERKALNCVSPALDNIIEDDEIFIDIEIDHVDKDHSGKVSSKEPSGNPTPEKTGNHQLLARGGGLVLILILSILVTTFFLLSPNIEAMFSKYNINTEI